MRRPPALVPAGLLLITMTMFNPPTSGILLRHLLKILDLRVPDRWRSLSTYFSGDRVLDKVRHDAALIVAELLAELLAGRRLVTLPHEPSADLLHGLVLMNAQQWDVLVGQVDRDAFAQVADLPFASRGFARILTMDVALRVAALRHLAGLPLLEPWDSRPGDLIKRLTLESSERTREVVAGMIPTSKTTLGDWCSHTIPDDASILKLARYLTGEETVMESAKQLEWRLRLRRHAAAWRLRSLVQEIFGSTAGGAAFVAHLCDGFILLVNAFLSFFEQSRAFAMKTGADPFHEEGWQTLHLALALEGRSALFHDAPGEAALQVRRAVARTIEDEHWRAVLITNDVAYLESHLTGLAGNRRALEQQRVDVASSLEREFSLWDSPVVGLVPFETDGSRVPWDLALLLVEADAKHLAGDIEGALVGRTMAAQKFPGSAIARFLLAALLGEAGHTTEAISICREALDLDPSFVTTYEELGALLFGARRFIEAGCILDQGLERAGDGASAELHYQRGLVRRALGDTVEADRSAQCAVDRTPRDSVVLASAAMAAMDAGDMRRARDHEREARFRAFPIVLPLRRR